MSTRTRHKERRGLGGPSETTSKSVHGAELPQGLTRRARGTRNATPAPFCPFKLENCFFLTVQRKTSRPRQEENQDLVGFLYIDVSVVFCLHFLGGGRQEHSRLRSLRLLSLITPGCLDCAQPTLCQAPRSPRGGRRGPPTTPTPTASFRAPKATCGCPRAVASAPLPP